MIIYVQTSIWLQYNCLLPSSMEPRRKLEEMERLKREEELLMHELLSGQSQHNTKIEQQSSEKEEFNTSEIKEEKKESLPPRQKMLQIKQFEALRRKHQLMAGIFSNQQQAQQEMKKEAKQQKIQVDNSQDEDLQLSLAIALSMNAPQQKPPKLSTLEKSANQYSKMGPLQQAFRSWRQMREKKKGRMQEVKLNEERELQKQREQLMREEEELKKERKKKELLEQIRRELNINLEMGGGEGKKVDIRDLLLCPITQTIMLSPMILTSCGHSFEEAAIRVWLQKNGICPLCNKPAAENNLLRNFSLAAICLVHH